jgi:hypothetical protein
VKYTHILHFPVLFCIKTILAGQSEYMTTQMNPTVSSLSTFIVITCCLPKKISSFIGLEGRLD